MNDLIINKVLSFDITALCNDGEQHTISFVDFVNMKESEFEIVSDDNDLTYYNINLHVECDGYGVTTDKVEKTKNMDINNILNQLEYYGKFKDILHYEDNKRENYIPVSVAKQIVRSRGLGGVLGYMEESIGE